MDTSTDNPFKREARTRKVAAMAVMARSARGGKGYTSAELDEFTDTQWVLLARACDREDASDSTRRRVVEVVRKMEATPQVADPFAGLA
jgi:hypothetical protein